MKNNKNKNTELSQKKSDKEKIKESEIIAPPSDDFMNLPIDYSWTNADVVNEYKKVKDKKKVARIYLITVQEVTQILKQENVL